MDRRDTLDVFFSYSHCDAELRNALDVHLALLKRQKVIRTWWDGEITAGEEWPPEIFGRLEKADVILLLISPDFIASDFCYSREMARAMERAPRPGPPGGTFEPSTLGPGIAIVRKGRRRSKSPQPAAARGACDTQPHPGLGEVVIRDHIELRHVRTIGENDAKRTRLSTAPVDALEIGVPLIERPCPGAAKLVVRAGADALVEAKGAGRGAGEVEQP